MTDLDVLESAIESVSEMLDRVLTYVRSVLSGETKGDPAVGRYLMDTLGASSEDLENGGFHASLQVRHKFSFLESFVTHRTVRMPLWFHTLPTLFDHKRKFPLVLHLLLHLRGNGKCCTLYTALSMAFVGILSYIARLASEVHEAQSPGTKLYSDARFS